MDLYKIFSSAPERGIPQQNKPIELYEIYKKPMKTSNMVVGFHGGDYEEWCLLGCYAMWLL
jgi:hypothetical protein